MKNKPLIIAGGVLAGLVLAATGVYGYMYASTPEHIRRPSMEHYHFRTQIVIDGEAVDFSRNEFQQEYDKNTCSVELSGTPIDFHDNADQMTHIHWDGMTGGQVLKYYGWNFIGGSDENLGRRYDHGMMSMQSVQRFSNALPAIPEGSNFYVYIGNEDGYQQKSWDDFLHKDLEEFFGKKSNLSQDEQASLFERLFFPKAYAHGGEIDEHTEGEEKTEEELTRINNLIGNVVIFVQKDEPTDEQIRERFSNLVPLHNSTCGG